MANRKIDRGWSEMTFSSPGKMVVAITGHKYCPCRCRHELFQVVTDHILVDPGSQYQTVFWVTQPRLYGVLYIYIIHHSQCDHLFLNGTQISNVKLRLLQVVAPRKYLRYILDMYKEQIIFVNGRFLFFLPLPTGPLLGS